jgi:hypothetical protein
MDSETLIQVVAVIDSEVESLCVMLDVISDDLNYEEDFAVKYTIKRLESLSDYFQGAIEAQVNNMEASQGE